MSGFNIGAYLKELEYLVNIDSGSRNPAGLLQIADYFEKKYTAIGWKVEKSYSGPEAAPCLIISNNESQPYDILFLGHMDTVFEKGEADKRPFTISGKRALGPGVIDMKAGLLSLYYVLESLYLYEEKSLSLCVLLNNDEEIGSRASKDLIKKLAGTSRCALVLEPARENGALVLERKGLGGYRVEFHGLAAHAGIEPEKGLNAIEELGHWIVELQKLNNPEMGTTFNVGVVTGGTVSNVVPDYAMLKADFRYLEASEPERISRVMEQMCLNPHIKGVNVDVKGGVSRPPMRYCEKTKELCRVVEAAADKFGIDFNWAVTGGGSDGNFAAAAGIPVIDGLGPVGGGTHSKEEYLAIDSVEPRIKLLREVILTICKDIR